MNNVLLDKNAGSRKLRDSCNEQGIVKCFLLPTAIRDTATDPEVAEFAVEHDDFILTFDRGFCDEASRALAGRNPGVLLLREDDGSVKRITIKAAMAILSQFKEQFQEWPKVPCKNSVVELTATLVTVYHTLREEPMLFGLLYRNQPDWKKQLRQMLEAIASGQTVPER